MGPILDAPFALHYVSTPGGYNYGNGVDRTLNGIETAAHFYNNSFYIFADTRDSEALHNIAATFTLNDPTATSVTAETSPTQAHGDVEHTLDFTATSTSTLLQFQFQNVPAH